MKSKKTFLILSIPILLICFILAYFSKSVPMNVINDEPSFRGIITNVTEKTITVSVYENEEEFKSSDKIIVSLNVKSKDSTTKFKIGDEVKIFYNGEILESYPSQINNVYEIQLLKN